MKNVSFDSVEIREYPVVLSTNPASQYGPAIELGWEYHMASNVLSLKVDEGRLSILEYESVRPSSRRRSTVGFYLPLYQRLHRVKIHNFSDDEILQAVKEKAAIHKSRKRSSSCLNPVSIARETYLGIRRTTKVKRAIRNLRKQPKERPDDIYKGWWWPLSTEFF